MILLTFQQGDRLRLGVKTAGRVLDVQAVAQALGAHVPATPEAFFTAGLAALPALQDLLARASSAPEQASWLRDEASLQLGPCVPDPGKIICIGLNYLRHAAESGMAPPKTPVLFSKFNNAVAAPNERVPLPAVAKEYDYEAELVVVIGKRARHVTAGDALTYVLGYCNGNDLSARDLQLLTGQWLLGKTLDKFLPLGPHLVTADEAGDPGAMSVRCWFNSELRQNSHTSDLIFNVPQLISYISRYLTLEPGDIISTGTPEGVILGRADKVWMKPGDEVTVEVGPLGRLTNVMCEER